MCNTQMPRGPPNLGLRQPAAAAGEGYVGNPLISPLGAMFEEACIHVSARFHSSTDSGQQRSIHVRVQLVDELPHNTAQGKDAVAGVRSGGVGASGADSSSSPPIPFSPAAPAPVAVNLKLRGELSRDEVLGAQDLAAHELLSKRPPAPPAAPGPSVTHADHFVQAVITGVLDSSDPANVLYASPRSLIAS